MPDFRLFHYKGDGGKKQYYFWMFDADKLNFKEYQYTNGYFRHHVMNRKEPHIIE